MDKISENKTIDGFKINNVVFTNMVIMDTKNDIDMNIIGVENNLNHAGFSISLNDISIYPLEKIILVD